jgi:hypothetical protein
MNNKGHPLSAQWEERILHFVPFPQEDFARYRNCAQCESSYSTKANAEPFEESSLRLSEKLRGTLALERRFRTNSHHSSGL